MMARSDYSALRRYSRALSVALGYRDMMTELHSQRVHGLSLQLGKQVGLDAAILERLSVAATFHDIGMIGIPDRVLLKPGRFNADERSIMQRHPETGGRIISATRLPEARIVAMIIRHHHEFYNGHGYPYGLAGIDIPVCARIIGIADSYDAMAVTRHHRRSLNHAEIMVILEKERGIKHDPWLLDHFATLIEHSEYRSRQE